MAASDASPPAAASSYYELATVDVDKPPRRPQQLDAVLCSAVAWGELAPLVLVGTTDNALHCYVPAGGRNSASASSTSTPPASALGFLRWHATYKRLYHPSAVVLDAWGVLLTIVDAKLTLYALPLPTNAQLEGSASAISTSISSSGNGGGGGGGGGGDGALLPMLQVAEDPKAGAAASAVVLAAAHEPARVVVAVTKTHGLRVYDWTAARRLELRAQHDLTVLCKALVGSTTAAASSSSSTSTTATTAAVAALLPVSRMLVLGESHVLVGFKKDGAYAVLNVDSGKFLPLQQQHRTPTTTTTAAMTALADGPALGAAVVIPPYRPHRPATRAPAAHLRDALLVTKTEMLRVALADATGRAPPTAVADVASVRVERVLELPAPPRHVHYHHPLVLVELPDKLAVYNVGTMRPVQTLPLRGLVAGAVAVPTSSSSQLSTRGRGRLTSLPPTVVVISASPFSIQALQLASPVATLIRRAVAAQRLEEAVTLGELCPEEMDLHDDELASLNADHGLELFRRGQFAEAMVAFARADVGATTVLRLYPSDLLPRAGLLAHRRPGGPAMTAHTRRGPRGGGNGPSRPDVDERFTVGAPLEGDDLVRAIVALMDFLSDHRETARGRQKMTTTSDDPTLSIVDTVLLKCLVLVSEHHERQAQQERQPQSQRQSTTADNDQDKDKANPVYRRLLELVRDENACEVAEAEVFLRAHHHFDVLLTFYATRRLHRKALELLEDLERSASMTTTTTASPTENRATLPPLAHASSTATALKTPGEYLALTADYLRGLGQSKAELVFEFSRRVVLVNPALGLSIFTSRRVPRGKEDLDPALVVTYLKSCQLDPTAAAAVATTAASRSAQADHDSASVDGEADALGSPLPLTDSRLLAIEYLLQMIARGKPGIGPRLHDDAVYLLLDAITAELQHPRGPSTTPSASAISTTTQPTPPLQPPTGTRLTSRVASQRELLGHLRRKLLAILEFPGAQFHPERILSRTPHEMVDERAALLSRLGRHHEVLQLYALELRDAGLAEAYCNRCYEAKWADSSIYSTLLRLYLRPMLPTGSASSSSILSLSSSSSPPHKPPGWQRSVSLQLPSASSTTAVTTTPAVHSSEAVAAAVSILNKYAERIDVPTALDLLPADVPVASLESSFRRVLERQVERYRNGQVKKQLAKMENFKVREALTIQRKESVTIWSSHCCQGCGKRLGIGTFVRLPGGALLHYACQPAP